MLTLTEEAKLQICSLYCQTENLKALKNTNNFVKV